MKLFFNYSKYYSVTGMILFNNDTLIYNSRLNIERQVQNSHNSIMAQLCYDFKAFLSRVSTLTRERY